MTYLKKLSDHKTYLSTIILDNAHALEQAIESCSKLQIGSFRITSKFFPAYTHPEVGYTLDQLPQVKEIYAQLNRCKHLIQQKNFRLTFHPDQFVVLSTPTPEILERSLQELEYQALAAELVGADVLNIHAGGVYGDKQSSLLRFEEAFLRLSPSAQQKLTIENDDKSYTPADLLPLCHKLKIPFVYDIHHHRCNPDHLTEEEVTKQALPTWNREPLFHISSPRNGWQGVHRNQHHDYIDPHDFPKKWLEIDPLTVEVEAKAKELAIMRLIKDLSH